MITLLVIIFSFFCVSPTLAVIDENIETIVLRYGYPFERHYVITEDGYILQLHRIRGGRNETDFLSSKNKPVVLLQHGLLGSSANWLTSGPDKSLAFLLADNGYDVWLGNSRGNEYSLHHLKKSSLGIDYWDFSWHEMGIYDLPAVLDYILPITNKSKIFYTGFSQGATEFFVLTSLKPEYNEKFELMVGLSPGLYTGRMIGLPLLMSFGTIYPVQKVVDKIGYFNFLFPTSMLRILTKHLCKKSHYITQTLCYLIIFSFVGFGFREADRNQLSEVLLFAPAGSSLKQYIHYAQQVYDPDNFRLYNYNTEKNKLLYNSTTPPKYPLEKVTTPVVFFHGTNDWLISMTSMKLAKSILPNVVESHELKGWNHYDTMFGIHNRRDIYMRVLQLMNSYKQKNSK